MANKSYQIGYRFQRRVLKYLQDKGFNCVVQPKSAFPDIIAWKPFVDNKGNFPLIVTNANIQGKIVKNDYIPFFVLMVECKVNKYLSKKEKEAAKKILEEGRCNLFLVAYKNKKRKIEFQEIGLNKVLKQRSSLPTYLG